MAFEPYMIDADTVAISKEDYENCRSWHLISNARPMEELLADMGVKIAKRESERLVRNIETFREHPEVGSGWVRGFCPHCGRYIDKDSSEAQCNFCCGAIKWR